MQTTIVHICIILASGAKKIIDNTCSKQNYPSTQTLFFKLPRDTNTPVYITSFTQSKLNNYFQNKKRIKYLAIDKIGNTSIKSTIKKIIIKK